MPHNIYKVTDFELVAPFTLRIRFDDNSQRTVNFEPETLHAWPEQADAMVLTRCRNFQHA